MAEANALFNILEDASGSGAAVRQVQLGDAPAAKNGLLAFGFRDSAGNITLPQLTADSRLPVSLDAAGDAKRSRGEQADGSASGTFVTVTEVSLTPGKTYVKVHGRVSSRQPALFQLVTVVDAVETVIEDAVLDAGEYNQLLGNEALELSVASGAASAVLRVKAYNFGTTASKLSPLRASLNCIEVVS